jgi:hypothetical protein
MGSRYRREAVLKSAEISEACGFGGDHCLAPSRTGDAPVDGASDRSDRLFPALPPLRGEDEALLALGVAGGICDGGEECDDAAETAPGWPLFGQFIAHDITAGRSPLSPSDQPETPVNFRTPKADLDSLYGSGQIGSPYLYRRDDPAQLATEVLIGILKADHGSYLATDPDWTPTLPARNGRFGLTDLLCAGERRG